MLQPREHVGLRSQTASSPTTDLGSIRLRIHYTADHVLPSSAYADLRELLLSSPSMQVCICLPFNIKKLTFVEY
jgi:hypothetical protein